MLAVVVRISRVGEVKTGSDETKAPMTRSCLAVGMAIALSAERSAAHRHWSARIVVAVLLNDMTSLGRGEATLEQLD